MVALGMRLHGWCEPHLVVLPVVATADTLFTALGAKSLAGAHHVGTSSGSHPHGVVAGTRLRIPNPRPLTLNPKP